MRGDLRTRFLAIGLIGGAFLTGCESVPARSPSKRLSLQTSEAVQPFAFQSCSAKISSADQRRLRDFLTSLRLSERDLLVVSIPRGCNPQGDAARQKHLVTLLAPYPARLHVDQAGGFSRAADETQGLIRAVRATGIAVDCGGAQGDLGCATAQNLAEMIAEPADLLLPEHGRRYLPPSSSKRRGED